MKILLGDLETRSRVDLKEAGHRRYARDPSTSITTAAWMWKGNHNSITGAVFLPGLAHLGHSSPLDFAMALEEADRVVFHNASFDISVIRETLKIDVPLRKISCTMARAQRLSLPGGLDGVASALGVPGKSPGGTMLVMKTCRPQRNGEFCEDEDVFRDLLAYNLQDVRALAEVDARLPELPPSERAIWERAWRKNELGLPLDLELASAVAAQRERIAAEVANELRELTGGAVTAVTQRQRIQAWLSTLGVPVVNLRKETIEEALEGELPWQAYAVLSILVESGGMAPTKADALLARHESGRYKDHTRYFGARSGRGTSEGVNTFNIARPSGKYDIPAAIEGVKFGWAFDNTALTDVLRGMVAAESRHAVIDADLANIEFRLVMWLADAKDMLRELSKRDGDPYIFNAKKMFGLPDDATKKTHPKERQDSKPVVLGGNYQLGHMKFYAMNRRKIPGLTLEKAQAWISGYRQGNVELSGRHGLWNGLRDAALEAYWRPNAIFEAAGGKVAFCVSIDNPWPAASGDSFSPDGSPVLRLRLPSGRVVPHYSPYVDRETGEFSFKRGRHGMMLSQRAYGGAWTEIICQSAARDVITAVEEQVEAELPDVQILMDVYDSVVCSTPASVGKERLAQILEIMERPIPWAPGLPIFGEGYVAERMRK